MQQESQTIFNLDTDSTPRWSITESPPLQTSYSVTKGVDGLLNIILRVCSGCKALRPHQIDAIQQHCPTKWITTAPQPLLSCSLSVT